MRRVLRHLRALASVAAAAFLVSALPGAAYGRPAAPVGPVGLPVIPSVLAPGAHCTGASSTQAHAQPWTVRALSLPRVHQLSRGAGVTVAVVDTGVSSSVPALSGRVTGAGNDCVGHGSFVAGLIAGEDKATGGGVAPQARILAVRGTGPRGEATPALVAAGIRSAVDGGARVVYVSAALTTGKEALTSAVAYATAKDALVVAPAVPDAAPQAVPGIVAFTAPPAQPNFPAFIEQVVSVQDFGQDGSRPKNALGVFASDLAAPGDAVVSVGPKGSGHYIGSGSSLAAAHVAGTAALIRAYQPQLTAAQVANRLVASAYPATTPVLDPYAAVAAIPSAAGAPAPPQAAVRMPGSVPRTPRTRALIIAATGGGLVAIVSAAAVIIPLGRSRRWRPAGRPE
jgi:membrane-anchored mycosin MYCP